MNNVKQLFSPVSDTYTGICHLGNQTYNTKQSQVVWYCVPTRNNFYRGMERPDENGAEVTVEGTRVLHAPSNTSMCQSWHRRCQMPHLGRWSGRDRASMLARPREAPPPV